MSPSVQRKLLIGTGNSGKLREIATILAGIPFELVSLRDVGEIEVPEESGSTYEENASLKARHYAQATGLITLADDSGLEVRALNGAPGLVSARYAGEGASDDNRRKLLLARMEGLSNGDRAARFVCAVVIAGPGSEVLHVATGICDGTIGYEPRGTHGFGYDPLFIPDGYQETFAELSEMIKNQISHRARALMVAKGFLLSGFRRSRWLARPIASK